MNKHENLSISYKESAEIKKILEKIVEDIRSLHETQVDLMVFPSGAITIDIKYRNRFLVFAYSPNNGFGVDDITDDRTFTSLFNFHTEELSVALEQIYFLIEKNKI